ncbi:MAG: transcription antitermination factor NusB [Deltaproteobacteria bacterium]|nr:transcription antitermination factor NusB [Deltaproteobacteria bacterium]
MSDAEEAGGGRHAGREVALQVLYAIDLGETGPRDAAHARAVRAAEEAARPPSAPKAMRPGARKKPAPLEVDAEAVGEGAVTVFDPVGASGEAFDRIVEHFDVPKTAREFARSLVAGVAAGATDLDELVGQHARNWRVERMAAVDRNVLRLGAFELRETETPVPVVIDEAVDLARRFGSDTSPSFVNGVLDAIARELRAA